MSIREWYCSIPTQYTEHIGATQSGIDDNKYEKVDLAHA